MHRLEGQARSREARRNFWLRGSRQPVVRAKCWADLFTKIRTKIRMDGGKDRFANFGLNAVANFGTNCWANIFTDRGMGIGVNFGSRNFGSGNFGTKRNGGERIASKNVGR